MKMNDGPVEITGDGVVTQGGQLIDTVRLEKAAKGTEPAREGESLWVPPGNKQLVDPKDRAVKQGYVEESNVNSMTSLIDMVAVQRSYSAVQKAIMEMDHANETITTQIARPL